MEVHSHGDHNIVRGISRAPQVIVIMRADGPWQTIRRAEVIDGPGFTIIRSENGAMSAIFSGQAAVNRGHDFHLMGPAKHVGEKLRQPA